MTIRLFKASLWVLVLLIPLCLQAQETDAQLWTRMALKWDPSDNTRLYIEEDIRFRENFSKLNKFHTEVGISQDLNKTWEIGGFYRWISLKDAYGSYDFRHRLATQLTYNYEVDDWKFWITPRLQFTFDDFNHSENWQIPETYLRGEIGVSYQSFNGKTEPYADFEIWHKIRKGLPDFVDQYRLTAGVEYKIDRNRRWDFFARYQQEIQVNNPLTALIVGVGYTYLIR